MRNAKIPAMLAIGLMLATANLAFAVDNDGDGYDTVIPPIDCDDFNAGRFPGNLEVINDGMDQDCAFGDACYVDADNDGHRTIALSTVNSFDVDCTDPGEATVADPADDCDDFNAGRFPGNLEVIDDGIDQDCVGGDVCYVDVDGDGYRPGNQTVQSIDLNCTDTGEATASDPAGDCDDFNGNRNPGQFEVIDDGLDQDCNGGDLCYLDDDSDGYRPVVIALVQSADLICGNDPDEATVADPATDCDDNSATINPGAVEVCDPADIDEDCDGDVDDADASVVDARVWYLDDDADGFGVTSEQVVGCLAPPGYVANENDCDDADGIINPGSPEICDPNDVDEDCDNFAYCADFDCAAEAECLGTVEVFDHLECFKIKTSERLKAYLDVNPGTNPPFELAQGCSIGKAVKYCVPVMKTVAIVLATSTLTPDADYEGQELTGDRICYKVRCPETAVSTATLTVKDRFGDREFTKLRSLEICTPAERVP